MANWKKQGLVFVSITSGLIVLTLIAVVAGGALSGAPAPTEEPAADTTPATVAPTPTASPLPENAPALQPAKGVSNLYIEYILDASGSMLELLPDGVPKREAAEKYLVEHMLEFAPETHLGLRSYGHRVPWQEDQEKSCEDIELIAPIEVGQMEPIADWLNEFETLGMTPLHASVEQALADFDTDAPDKLNNIILISDGIETCGGNPCELAKQMKMEGINFTIHVIGLYVDAPAREQLSCIAEEGGGVYYDVESSEDFAAALRAIQEDVREDEQVLSYEEATQTANPPTDTPEPTDTPTSTGTPSPTDTPQPTLTPVPPTVTPPPPPPTNPPVPTDTPGPTPTDPPSPTPTQDVQAGCAKPTIAEFYAAPPNPGSSASFVLKWTIQGADRAEIFGHPVDPNSGSFDVWESEETYWVLWAKVSGTPDDCYVEQAIQVDPDSIGSPTGFSDVTVNDNVIEISVRDNASVDGDRIDLFVNGKKVMGDVLLTSSPQTVRVKLNSGENTIQVTALNEGTHSPNTVEVSITNVTEGNAVQISSGLKTGQSTSFNVYAP